MVFELRRLNQDKLMSTFDIKIGQMQMTFMHPTVQERRSSTDYRKIDFEDLAKDVHPIDQTEFHV